MLIEFRVENHKSLRDEQALTLEASRLGESDDGVPREVGGHKQRLLPAGVIYGANASGKSNMLAALSFMHEAVLASHSRWDPEGGIPRTPFAWGEKRDQPSLFEAAMTIDGTKYEYGFEADDEKICEEWIFAWPNNRRQVWLEREDRSFKFGENLRGPNESVREVTRPNALFLSTAAQLGHEQLAKLYGWFRRVYPVNTPGRRFATYFGRFNELFFPAEDDQASLFPQLSEDTLVSRMRDLLRAADVGIVDMKKVDVELELRGRVRRRQRIMLQHQPGDEDSWLDFEEESDGTKTLLRMAPSLFRALETGGLLVVDELESSLHPLLGLEIVKLFNCPKANPRNAQILFTTHDTNLLGTTLGDPVLRRDQVWFTEKDAEGATTVYPITDFKPRKVENLERGYLQGRYGAIPFFGNISVLSE